MIFHFSKDFDLHDCSRERIELTRGDSLYMTARVFGGRPIGSACFALYKPGQYGGEALANVTEFVPVEGDKHTDYMGILRLNTEALTALVGAGDCIEVEGEWEIKYADDDGNIITHTPGRVEVLIYNDYIKQSPPSQVDPEVVYATEGFVEAVLKDRVKTETETALGVIRDEVDADADRAEQARDGAEQARIDADGSEDAAKSYALSARESAARSADNALQAGISKEACEEYAGLARQSEAIAAKSASQAKADADKAERIAGTLGTDIEDAKNAAAQAKISETNAAKSAEEARTSVNSIGTSVSDAKSYADTAKAAAISSQTAEATATTKAGEAKASATQAQASAMTATTAAGNAAQSEFIAREKATGAATSAIQAAQSASEASLSAEDVRRIAAEVVAMMKEIVPPRINYDGNHFYFNKFTEPAYPDDKCVYPYGYLQKKVGGRDNYQLWKEAGNTGTLEDFLAAMRGPAGDEQALQEVREQLQLKAEVVMISAADYEELAERAPHVLYAIIEQ